MSFDCELTIIILTYNSARVIEPCLESLDSKRYKIIMVDNASSDNCINLVQTKFPDVKIIKLEKNIGYGRGNNAALKIVDTKFALILNPDAIISSENIEKVLNGMKNNPKAALAGPITLEEVPFNQYEIEDKITEISKNLLTKNSDGTFNVKFIVGAALFIKREHLKKMGGFDENIFLYYEDDELCLRSIKKGYQNIIIPDAFAFHIGGNSTSPNAKVTFKKSWHLIWSKLYWNSLRKGKLSAKKSALRLAIFNFFKSLFSLFKFDKSLFLQNMGTCSGAFSYLIGLKAFKKNGDSRG